MTRRIGPMSLVATSILVLAACGGTDDLLSPSRAANPAGPSLSKMSAAVDLDVEVTQDTLAVGDTATIYATGSRSTTGVMYYYAADPTVLKVDSKSGAFQAKRIGRTRLFGVLQVPTYPVTYVDMVVGATGSRHKVAGETTTTTTAEPAALPVAPLATAPAAAGALPELPRRTVDVSVPAQTGRTIRVAAGGDLQAAINSARIGDVIALDPNATFVGNFTLPNRGDAGWVTIRSSASDATLPAAGVRLRPAAVGALPKILTDNAAPAVRTLSGASGWRFFAVEISATPTLTMNYGLVALGDASSAQNTLASVPSRLILDRVYVHGTPRLEVRRCVALNSATSAVVNSTVTECHSNIGDSQAIWGWNGPGPFRIENNYLTAGHEVVGFGGPTPSIAGLVPADIEIRHNHITRPMAWQGVWNTKNLFEMKGGQRVLFEGNVLENNWVNAQNGFAIILQVLSDDNTALWTKITDVTIRNNVIRNTPGGINLYARVTYGGAGTMPTTPMSRVQVSNNLIDVAQNPSLGANGKTFQLLSDLHDVRIENNTASSRSSVMLFDVAPTVGLVVTGNLFGRADWAVIGNGTGEGRATFAKFAPDGTVRDNVFAGANAAQYPTGNFYPAGADVGVASLTAGGIRLSNGGTPGADLTAIARATAGVIVP